MEKAADGTLRLKVTEALGKDVGRALARMDPADIKALGAEIGDIVEIAGKRRTVCKVMPAYKDARGGARVQLDGLSRGNAGVALDDVVTVRKVLARPAERIVLSPTAPGSSDRDLQYIGTRLDGLPVVEGDRIRGTLFGSRSLDFLVWETAPKGPVLIAPPTLLTVGPVCAESRMSIRSGDPPCPTRTSAGFGGKSSACVRSSNCRCAIRRCSPGSALMRPRGSCSTAPPAAAKPSLRGPSRMKPTCASSRSTGRRSSASFMGERESLARHLRPGRPTGPEHHFH